MSVFVEIAFAQLQEAAERAQGAQVLVDRFPGQGVEHHIHAFALGVFQDFFGEGERARVIESLDAHQTQEVALLFGAHRGVNFRSQPLGYLQRCNAHAARGAVNQDFFARFDSRQMLERVVDREEGRRNRRRGGKANAFRQCCNGVLVGNDLVAKAGRAEADHGLPRRHVGDVAAHGLDHA